MYRRLLIVVVLMSVLVAACSSEDGGETRLPTPPPTITALPAMTPTPVPPPVAEGALPPVDWDNPAYLQEYEQAMRPAFAEDVYAYADRNRYYIEASLVFEDQVDASGEVVFPDRVAVIRGAQRVRYTNHADETLDEIVFRLYANLPALGGRMEVYNATVNGEPVAPGLSERETVLTLRLADADGAPLVPGTVEPLAPGESVEIMMQFSVAAERGMFASYGAFGFQNDVFSGPEWYPVLSVYDADAGWWTVRPNPTGDAVYSATGLYDVRFTTPEDFRVAMSGSLVNGEVGDDGREVCPDTGDGTRTCRFLSGPMRDSLVVAGPNFGKITGCAEANAILDVGQTCDPDDVAVNVYHWPGDEAVALNVLQFSLDSVRIFSEKFGPYPYAELDVAETFNYTGIEYPGIIVIAARNWERGNQFLEITTTHEVAHQWWYGVVGNNQVGKPWLDESLTSYSEYVYMRNVYDERRGADLVDSDDRSYKRYKDNGWPDLAMGLSTAAYNGGNYGMIIYVKGPLFYQRLENELLGREAFFDAVQLYFQRHRYEIVRSRDVLEAFEDSSGRDLDRSFYNWVGDFPGLDRREDCRGDARPPYDAVTTSVSRRAVRWLYGSACGSGRILPAGQQLSP